MDIDFVHLRKMLKCQLILFQTIITNQDQWDEVLLKKGVVGTVSIFCLISHENIYSFSQIYIYIIYSLIDTCHKSGRLVSYYILKKVYINIFIKLYIVFMDTYGLL